MPFSTLTEFWRNRKAREFYAIPGMKRLTELLGGGFIKGGSHLIYAETGRGKTSFVVDMCTRWLLETELKICFISLEEDMEEIQSRFAARLLDASTKRSYRDILAGAISEKETTDVADFWDNWQDRLDLVNITSNSDKPLTELNYLKHEIGKRVYDFDIFVIDHIHHVNMKNKDNQFIITSLLADHIKELTNNGATIIALAQMRKPENAKQLEDFGNRTYASIAGSSKNMQNATTITHLYFTRRQNTANEKAVTAKRYDEMMAILRVEKSRYGKRGGLIVNFNPTNCKFIEEPHDPKRYMDAHDGFDK